MSDRDYFHVFLKNLSTYFDEKLTKTKIDDAFNKKNNESETSDEETSENDEPAYNNLKLIKNVKSDPNFLPVLMEISSYNAKKIRENRNFLSNFDDWNFFLKHINYKDYINFTDCLLRLIQMDVKDEKNRKLSIYAAKAYFILMSVPDSKVVGVFQINEIFQKCFEIFDVLIDLEVKLNLEELSKFQILIIDYLNDIAFFLKFCFLNDLEDLQKMFIKKLFKIVKNYYVNGFVTKDDFLICDAIYKVIEQMCKPCHGDLNQIYQSIFDETLLLYIYKQPLVTRTGEVVQCSTECSYIIQFGIKLYEANPEPMIQWFDKFALTVITSDPDHMSSDHFNIFTDALLVYDKEFSNHNMLTFVAVLLTHTNSSSHKIRLNVLKIIEKMIKINYEIPVFFRMHTPREFLILISLINKIIDKNEEVSLKALTILNKLRLIGNEQIKSYLEDLFEFQLEHDLRPEDFGEKIGKMNYQKIILPPAPKFINYEFPVKRKDSRLQIVHGFPEYQTAENDLKNYLRNINFMCVYNENPQIQVEALGLYESHSLHNEFVVMDKQFRFTSQTILLQNSAPIIKRLCELYETLISKFHTTPELLQNYSVFLLKLFYSNNKSLVDLGIRSIKKCCFDKICYSDMAGNSSAKQPWLILHYVYYNNKCKEFPKTVQEFIVKYGETKEFMKKLESYFQKEGSYVFPLWSLLSSISQTVFADYAEFYVRDFTNYVNSNEIKNPMILCSMMAVTNNWLRKLGKATLQVVLRTLQDMMRSGTGYNSLFPICYDLSKKVKTALGPSDVNFEYKLVNDFEKVLISKRKDLMDSASKNDFPFNLLTIYTEIMLDCDFDNREIINLLKEFLEKVANEKWTLVTSDLKLIKKFNGAFVVSSKLALKYSAFGKSFIESVSKIIRLPSFYQTFSIVNNAVTILPDFLPKYPSSVLKMLIFLTDVITDERTDDDRICCKVLSEITWLVTENLIKLEGQILLNLFRVLMSDNQKRRKSVNYLIGIYREKVKNDFLQISLLEVIFALNGFYEHTFKYFQLNLILKNKFDCKLRANLETRNRVYRIYYRMDDVDANNFFCSMTILLSKFDAMNSQEVGREAIFDILRIYKVMTEYKMKIGLKTPEVQQFEEVQGGEGVAGSSEDKATTSHHQSPYEQSMEELSQTINCIPDLHEKIKLSENLEFVSLFNAFLKNFYKIHQEKCDGSGRIKFWQSITKLPIVDVDFYNLNCETECDSLFVDELSDDEDKSNLNEDVDGLGSDGGIDGA